MNSTKTTTELKSLARELLMGKYGSYILAFLIQHKYIQTNQNSQGNIEANTNEITP